MLIYISNYASFILRCIFSYTIKIKEQYFDNTRIKKIIGDIMGYLLLLEIGLVASHIAANKHHFTNIFFSFHFMNSHNLVFKLQI